MKISLLITFLSIPTINLFADDILKNVNLDEITVTATGYKQDISKAPASVSVISNKEIEKKYLSSDITDIVKKVPGVFSNQGVASNFRKKSHIIIRGMSVKYTKFLVDGRPISSKDAYSNLGSAGIIGFLPPAADIQRIEIIRGPMSSLYGTDAMGGVINIITKKSINEFSANINAYYTFMQDRDYGNSFNSSFYVNSPLSSDDIILQLYGKFAQKHEDKILEANPKFRDENVGAKITYRLNDDNDILIDYKYANNFAQQTVKTSNRPIKFYDDNNILTISHLGYYNNLTMNSYVLYDRTNSSSSKVGGDSKLDSMIFNTTGNYVFENNILSLGLEYSNSILNATQENQKAKKPKLKASKYDMALYGEDEFNIIEPLILTLGLRYNYDENYGNHISPRAYLAYQINDELTLKGGISTGYMTPSIKQSQKEFLNPASSGAGVTPGNPNLKPETSLAYEGSVYYKNDIVGASATIFYTDFKDYIGTNTLCISGKKGNPATWKCEYEGQKYWKVQEYINSGKSKIQGAEISANILIEDNLNIQTSYTFSKSKQKTGEQKGEPLNDVPTHLFRIGGDYDLISNLNIWTDLLYNGRTKEHKYGKELRNARGGYTSLDIGMNYNFIKNLKLNLSIYNLLNKKYEADEHKGKITVLDGRKFQIGFNLNF